MINTLTMLSLFFLLKISLAFAPHKIKKWPGQPDLPKFGQYGGHITVNTTSGKKFYYLFTESPQQPERKPLVLWLNGGPGCSSIFNGFFGEHGPWRVANEKGSSLVYNPFSWHLEANIIYLESPVGVGFSFSESLDDYSTNDLQTASDNYIFLQNWIAKFPQYKDRPFYITGESYAGHYATQLSVEILKGNSNPKNRKLNFQGLMMGNPYFRGDKSSSFLTALYNRYAVSQKTYDNFNKHCLKNYEVRQCDATFTVLFKELGDIDIYDLYSPVCQYKSNGVLAEVKQNSGNRKLLGTETKSSVDSGSHQTPVVENQIYPSLRKSNLHLVMDALDFYDKLKQRQGSASTTKRSAAGTNTVSNSADSVNPPPFSLSNPACMDHWTVTYMNRPEVQKAINVDMSKAYYQTYYLPCSYVTNYDTTITPDSLYTFDTLFKSSLRIWIYSGDTDTIVPFSMTRKDLKTLNRPLKTTLFPWYHYDQPAGWSEIYDKLTVLTVRGAGHLVPKSEPRRALFLLRIFLKGTPPPAVPFS